MSFSLTDDYEFVIATAMSAPIPFDAKAVIQEIGWPQPKLAEEVGVDQSTVSLWYTKRSKPRGPAQRILLQVLDRVRAERKDDAA